MIRVYRHGPARGRRLVARLLLRVAAAVLRVADLAHEAVLGRPRVDERAEDSRERFVPRMAARGRRRLAVVANKVGRTCRQHAASATASRRTRMFFSRFCS